MSNIEEYLDLQEKLISERFNHIRSSYSDSDVKGGANEGVVTDFLKEYLSDRFLANNSEVIDSYGHRSNEVDICVCNRDQPISKEKGGILIAEGIDFVVQVKAKLTKPEVRRALDNCKSVKLLERKRDKRDIFAAMDADIPYFVQRIPYFVFAFTAASKFETLCRNIYDMVESVDYIHQPDAFFILGEGFVFNHREGRGAGLEINGKVPEGLFALSTKHNLSDFMGYIHLIVPRFYRVIDPMKYYIRDKINITLQQLWF